MDINSSSVYAPTFVLKHSPKDFQVNESYIIPLDIPQQENLHFFILQKIGFTTFDAVHCCSEFFNILKEDVSFFGLKDENAITQQLLCIRISSDDVAKDNIEKFNMQFYSSDLSYLKLIYYQKSPAKLEIGGLSGNVFSLTIRKLSKNAIQQLFDRNKMEFTFINYYGTQRFGLPGQEANTHIIGKHIIDSDYVCAFEKIKGQKSRLGESAKNFKGEAADFFKSMDNKERNFFINSYYSSLWNDDVKAYLENNCSELVKYYENEIIYLLPGAQLPNNFKDINDTLVQYKTQPESSEILLKPFCRPALIQVFFNILNVDNDDVFDGHSKLSISFNLPPGAYATMAILQLLFYLEKELLCP